MADPEDTDPGMGDEGAAETPTTDEPRWKSTLNSPAVRTTLIVLGVIVAVLLVWFLIKYIKHRRKNAPMLVERPRAVGSVVSLTGDRVPALSMDGLESTYSIWIYIRDWGADTYNQHKHIFHRGDGPPGESGFDVAT